MLEKASPETTALVITDPQCSTTIIFDHRDYDSCPLKWVFV